MKVRERIYRISEEALPILEERLFDIGAYRFAIEWDKNGIIFKSYESSIDEVLKDLGYTPEGEKTVDPLEWAKDVLKEPFEIAPGVLVDPVGNYEGEGIVLKITPGMAFGTGIHPTTKMCASFLKSLDLKGKSVLDIGAGTAILAILAKKLGAAHVLGVDNDPLALEVAKENIKKNCVDIEIKHSDLLQNVKGKFDVVVANIVPPVLRRLAREIKTVLNEEGFLIISGIDKGAEDTIDVFLERGFTLLEKRSEGEWIAAILK